MKNRISADTVSGPSDRREVLLRMAEQLFASKGIDAVSLNEINKAAGQRNTSALHYHFGSKEKLIEAIIYQEFDDIIARMNDELSTLESVPDFTARQLVIAVTTPFIEMLDSPRGVNYLRIMVQLLDRNANMPFFSQPDSVEQVKVRAFALAESFFGHLPDQVKITRLILFSTLLFRSLVAYSQFESHDGDNIMGNKDFFIGVLRDSLERIIFDPLSAEAQALLQR